MNLCLNPVPSRKFSSCILALGIASAGLGAVERLPEDQRKNGETTLQAFSKSSEASLASTVRLVRNGRPLALGTIVSKKGHVITKAASASGLMRRSSPTARAIPCAFVAATRKLIWFFFN